MNSFPRFSNECRSLLCKYLTPEVYEELKELKTANGYTLDKAINSGVENPDSAIGVYAGDVESYSLFAPLFDPIIQEYHGFSASNLHRSDLDSKQLSAAVLDPDGHYILSTRIRVGRNLADMPLGTCISKEQRKEVEKLVSTALLGLHGELSGSYYPLDGMDEKTHQQLIQDHFLFKAGDRFLEAAGLNRDWPSGRGIFHNRAKSFLVWVNEEDQLRIISMQKGGDIKTVFTRLVKAVREIEKSIGFAHTEHLGYITSCPTNLGTAMRASVHIRLTKLAEHMALFKEITDRHHLQIRGIHGEHSKSEGGVFDISNRRRLGVTELECVQEMYDGVAALIAAEEAL